MEDEPFAAGRLSDELEFALDHRPKTSAIRASLRVGAEDLQI
jgi:hypothetical protein